MDISFPQILSDEIIMSVYSEIWKNFA